MRTGWHRLSGKGDRPSILDQMRPLQTPVTSTVAPRQAEPLRVRPGALGKRFRRHSPPHYPAPQLRSERAPLLWCPRTLQQTSPLHSPLPDSLITLDCVVRKGPKELEKHNQAMRSIFVVLRARARASITTGREELQQPHHQPPSRKQSRASLESPGDTLLPSEPVRPPPAHPSHPPTPPPTP